VVQAILVNTVEACAGLERATNMAAIRLLWIICVKFTSAHALRLVIQTGKKVWQCLHFWKLQPYCRIEMRTGWAKNWAVFISSYISCIWWSRNGFHVVKCLVLSLE